MTRRDDRTDADWSVYAERLGTELQRARLRSGLSQEQVAYRAGMSRYTYQKYEKGESRPGTAANPTLRSMLAIAQVLEIPLHAMLPDEAPDLRVR
ncbi:helix-turn-helix domain-containing protein [Microbacterium sp. zg.Y1090]|uniref:helix-turn-helix transcriptional regulator n=1 Tax=Microbacterium wangruii TaxID=3049073 RepID=UPI00214DAC40|nr:MULTISPECIES: helix-turn-helix transcriptional regulator [unclassified Microbacterium]MCR2818929.1 helix-turn-helix domain-containing protein [Microbacterium sp. zg.Y1090]WIM27236.1 helix-turn-helix transcriptional regulator [Microbacterium sp. zg-Y1090]